jgi:hypothetical protein
VQLVLAGGDRLTGVDVIESPALAQFTAVPELAEVTEAEDLNALLGEDPDAIADELPDLDEDLEGSTVDSDFGVLATGTTGAGIE